MTVKFADFAKKTTQATPRKYSKARFQLEDLAQLRAKRNSWNLSEMGCYKTSTALWLAEDLLRTLPQSATRRTILYVTSKTGKTPVLEILPSLFPNWQCNIVDSSGPRLINPKATGHALYLCHYELFQKRSSYAKTLATHKWSMAILDEAHRIKSPKAQITRSIWQVKPQFKHLMTGSPFANNIGELFSLAHWLAPSEFSSYNDFVAKYGVFEMSYSGYQKLGVGVKEVEALKKLIARFGVRRKQREIFPDLPELFPIQHVPVDLNPTQRRMYAEFQKEWEAEDPLGEHILTPTELARLTRLRQLCAATPHKEDEYFDEQMQRRVFKIRLAEPSSKLDALFELLTGTDQPFVIFSCFNGALQLLKARLDKAKISYIHLEQKDKDWTRKLKVQAFQEGKARAFLTGIRLGGESITLTRANKVAFIDRDWNPQKNEQGIARVMRPGQSKAVQVIYLEARNTVDQKVEADIFGKMVTFNKVFN